MGICTSLALTILSVHWYELNSQLTVLHVISIAKYCGLCVGYRDMYQIEHDLSILIPSLGSVA